MQWLADAASNDIVGNVYLQWGFLGILGLVIVFVGRYLLKDNNQLKLDKLALQKTIDELQDARLQDAKDFANIKAQPTEELVRFVRNLYDGDGKRGN